MLPFGDFSDLLGELALPHQPAGKLQATVLGHALKLVPLSRILTTQVPQSSDFSLPTSGLAQTQQGTLFFLVHLILACVHLQLSRVWQEETEPLRVPRVSLGDTFPLLSRRTKQIAVDHRGTR